MNKHYNQNFNSICIMDLRLRMGSNMLVIGPTGSGKSFFIVRLIENGEQVFNIKPANVYWCYGHRTALHEQLTARNFNMIDGLPQNFDFIQPNSIIVLDDLMFDAANSELVTQLFIRGAHHIPCFVIFTQHNLFHRSGESRNRQLNTQYMVLFKNPRDAAQLNFLSNQMFPNSKHYLTSIFQRATFNQHAYLFLDLHQKTPEIVRVRARILPHERPMHAYVNKQLYSDIALKR